MPDYALICRDAPDALARRMDTRGAHMDGLKVEKAAGRIIDGGAILAPDGSMCGSVVLCRFDDRAALDAYLAREIYIRENVWDTIEVIEMRLVDWTTLMSSANFPTTEKD